MFYYSRTEEKNVLTPKIWLRTAAMIPLSRPDEVMEPMAVSRRSGTGQWNAAHPSFSPASMISVMLSPFNMIRPENSGGNTLHEEP